jgi:hypothetical protein
VYLTGTACTGDFPITAGAFEPQNLDGEFTAECTAFLTKLNPAPNTPLLYSTFFGGTGNTDPYDYSYGEGANGLAVDPSGNVYLAGFTSSIDFPTTAGVVETAFGGQSEEAFVTEFNGSEMKSLPIPTVTLTSSTSSVLFGRPVTFTATVHPASGNNTPTGYVGFNFFQLETSDDEGLGAGFGPWTTVALNGSGVATFTTSSLEGLQTQVNAFYLGDTNNAPATGTMTQTLTDIPTTTTVTSSTNNVPYGTLVVFTATALDNTASRRRVSFSLCWVILLMKNQALTVLATQRGPTAPADRRFRSAPITSKSNSFHILDTRKAAERWWRRLLLWGQQPIPLLPRPQQCSVQPSKLLWVTRTPPPSSITRPMEVSRRRVLHFSSPLG